MAGPTNKMTNLINKMEGRLGLRNVPKPDEYVKEKWAENIIIPDTLETFSRFFPKRIKYHVDQYTQYKDGWYYIDNSKLGPDVEVLGIQDIDWNSVGNRISTGAYGTIDPWSMYNNFNPLSLGIAQVTADYTSLFNMGIYVETQDTNKFKLQSCIGQDMKGFFTEFDIYIIIKHSPSLVTISPTMMEKFEQLAEIDIARYLYNNLKYYDGLETTYATLNLHLDELSRIADKRDELIEELDNAHVSGDNPSQPCFIVS